MMGGESVRRAIAPVAALALLLGGCAAKPAFYQAGMPADIMAFDTADCWRHAVTGTSGSGVQPSIREQGAAAEAGVELGAAIGEWADQRRAYIACMEGRGYSRTKMKRSGN